MESHKRTQADVEKAETSSSFGRVTPGVNNEAHDYEVKAETQASLDVQLKGEAKADEEKGQAPASLAVQAQGGPQDNVRSAYHFLFVDEPGFLWYKLLAWLIVGLQLALIVLAGVILPFELQKAGSIQYPWRWIRWVWVRWFALPICSLHAAASVSNKWGTTLFLGRDKHCCKKHVLAAIMLLWLFVMATFMGHAKTLHSLLSTFLGVSFALQVDVLVASAIPKPMPPGFYSTTDKTQWARSYLLEKIGELHGCQITTEDICNGVRYFILLYTTIFNIVCVVLTTQLDVGVNERVGVRWWLGWLFSFSYWYLALLVLWLYAWRIVESPIFIARHRCESEYRRVRRIHFGVMLAIIMDIIFS